VELEDDLAERLDRVARGRARKRSDFNRAASRRALKELEEKATVAQNTVPDRKGRSRRT
jgi:metal-responsive CopG/Arc/MetJ family transcriptional regulator